MLNASLAQIYDKDALEARLLSWSTIPVTRIFSLRDCSPYTL